MRTIVIVQARMGSTRLPGKVLEDLGGVPLLDWSVTRSQRARVDAVVVATSVQPADDVIVDLCRARGWPVWRGSEHDVLQRYHEAAAFYDAELVVRITSDCPFTDPALIDASTAFFHDHADEFDLITNMYPPTWPLGLAVEVLPFRVLERMQRLATRSPHREHVTAMGYDHPELFRLANLPCTEDLHLHRWTVDTPEDLQLVRAVTARLAGNAFGWREVLGVVQANPQLQKLNAHVVQRTV
jgi:spore coat polysaccharide biosynthesis protein SpsF